MDKKDLPRFLTPLEVARQLGIQKCKVLEFINAGLLPAVDVAKVGSCRPYWRISPENFQQFLDARAAKPRPKVRKRKAKPTKQYV